MTSKRYSHLPVLFVALLTFTSCDHLFRPPAPPSKSERQKPLFASMLAERIGVPVAVISVGCGGTSVTDWLPQIAPGASTVGGYIAGSSSALACTSGNPLYYKNLYARLRDTLGMLGHQGARAVFWHQGETDAVAGMSANDYQYRLGFILNQLNFDTTTTWNYFVARASYFPGDDVDGINCSSTGRPNQFAANMAQIVSAQANLTNLGLAYEGASTDSLWGGQYRYLPNGGSCVHFNETGLNLNAQRWLQALAQSQIVPGL
jgi:hypothetical protein